jgi:hypothetical protein
MEEKEVLPVVRQYRDLYMEQQAIQQEIKNFKKRYEKRLVEIKKSLGELEQELLVYMREHDHPGLRFQEVILLSEDKVFSKNSKKREEEVQEILQKHRVDPTNPLYRELLETAQASKIRESHQRIKMKVYKKET